MRHRVALPAFALCAALGLTSIACSAGNGLENDPPGDPYRPVSELVSLPDFLPGLGRLYVDPDTLPAGPYLAYDRKGKLASTVYMIPLDAMNERESFESLGTPGESVVSVDVTFNPGHPGLAEPHYHVTLHHLNPSEAALN